jgi:hypothetical protein
MMTYISRVDQATGDAEFAHGQNDWTPMTLECDLDPTDGCGDTPTLRLP